MPSETRKKLVVLYQELYQLTNPKCGACRLPNSCCSQEYCELTMEYAREEWGVELQPTEHPTLPLMGEKGCTAAPHLRPQCTAHVCEQHLMRPDEFAEKYFDLRDRVNDAEMLRLTEEEKEI